MSIPKAYQVVITTSHGLNIILGNKKEIYYRSFSRFVTAADAKQFAVHLAQALENGIYTEVERCPVCGQIFTRQNRFSLLRDGRVVHRKCFENAVKHREMTDDDCEVFFHHVFPKDAPLFDYTNITYEPESKEFRYAIQTVSKSVIHLHLIEPNHYMKHRFCLTYDECQGLIREIRAKLELLQTYLDTAVGKCACCGHSIYMDKNYYKMASGEVIHEKCMERFIQSRASANVRFPAMWIPGRDVFGYVQNNEVPYWYF